MKLSFLTGVITYISRLARKVSGEKYFSSLLYPLGVSGSASPVSPEFLLFFSHPGAVLGAAEQGPGDQVDLLQEQGYQDCEAEPGALLEASHRPPEGSWTASPPARQAGCWTESHAGCHGGFFKVR